MELLAEALFLVAWGFFVVDNFTRPAITENRWEWFYRHLLDLAVVMLPMLRPFRLMRFLAAIALIQWGAGGILRGRVVLVTIGSTVLIVHAGSDTAAAAGPVIDSVGPHGNTRRAGDRLGTQRGAAMVVA